MSTSEQRQNREEGEVLVADDFSAHLVRGLSAPNKFIPSRFFYDARGSALFEQITALPEYYPTNCETVILNDHGTEIRDALRSIATIVEFGSGSSTKTEILLQYMSALQSYVAIDVSASALRDAKARLASKFPDLNLQSIVADFSHVFQLPKDLQKSPMAGFFPGSTIGNFHPTGAIELLKTFAKTLGEPGRLIIGVDLYKDLKILDRAYNDGEGITAEFNLNLLRRANSEARADFDLEAFTHYAAYDSETGGVDMYLVSDVAQTVMLNGHAIRFRAGERVHTEHSHKYKKLEFHSVAEKGGWHVVQAWTDPKDMFAVFDLACA